MLGVIIWVQSKIGEKVFLGENVALMTCVSKSSTDMFIGIKSYIYNCSEKEVDGKFYEVTLQLVCRILSIPLRDLYLEEHPEIIR